MLEDVTRYVSSVSVSRSKESPVLRASIGISHDRLPYFKTRSFSSGPQDCHIWTMLRTKTQTDMRWVFKGTTESSPNAGLLRPSGTLTAVSDSARWADKPGCLLVTAFAGFTRLELLEAFSLNFGVSLTVSGDLTSAVIKKPVDIAGVNLIELLKRWLPMDGGVYRELDGGLEVIPFADVAGPAVTPAFDFTPETYFSLEEAPPARPVTDQILWGESPVLLPDGVQDPIEVLDGGTGPAKTVVTRTIADGVITQEVTERHENYIVKGVTNAAEDLLKISEVTIDYTHDTTGGGAPNGRLLTKTTTTKRYYAPLASTGTGDPNYTFEDGTFHTQNAETFQEVEKVEETYEWDTDSCVLKSGEVIRTGWLAPLSEASSGDPEETWTADDSVRSQTEETYQMVSRLVFNQNLWVPADGWPTQSSDPLRLYLGQGRPPEGRCYWRLEGEERGMELGTNTQVRRNWERASLWIENPDGQRHTKVTKTWQGSDAAAIRCADVLGLGIGAEAGFAGWTPEVINEDVPGPIPEPATQSGVTRMFALRPFIVAVRVSSPMPQTIESEHVIEAESKAEAERLGKWRARMEFAPRLTIAHPLYPDLDIWTPVRVTSTRIQSPAGGIVNVRNYTLRPGWIEAIDTALEIGDGGWGLCKARQKSVVALDVFPSVDPS